LFFLIKRFLFSFTSETITAGSTTAATKANIKL
jgi:hypothetical protein